MYWNSNFSTLFLFPLIYSVSIFFSIVSTADTESMEPGAIQDILTCGLCQKTFALADIVKFIQHKVLQCNKENYEQCFTQGTTPRNYLFSFLLPQKANTDFLRIFSSIVCSSIPNIKSKHFVVFSLGSGGSTDRDSEDSRPLALANRRPSISAPISTRKPSSSSSRVHTPPLESPGFVSGDGTSSTPKRLSAEGKRNSWLLQIFYRIVKLIHLQFTHFSKLRAHRRQRQFELET